MPDTQEGTEGLKEGAQSLCWASQFFDDACSPGRFDRMHIGFRKQYLRKKGLSEDQVWDERVWKWGCRRHHERLDGPYFTLHRDQLPASVEDYAQEHELVHQLDWNLGPRA